MAPVDESPTATITAPLAERLSAETLVNTATGSIQGAPTITTLRSGGFVVSWIDNSSAGGDSSSCGIKAQVFNAAGVKVGTELLVTTTRASAQYAATITSLACEGFVFSWEYYSSTINDPGRFIESQMPIDDGGNPGTGGALTGSDRETIFITAVNDAAVLANARRHRDLSGRHGAGGDRAQSDGDAPRQRYSSERDRDDHGELSKWRRARRNDCRPGGNFLVEAETIGDGAADLSILVTSDHARTANEFVGVTDQTGAISVSIDGDMRAAFIGGMSAPIDMHPAMMPTHEQFMPEVIA